VQAEALAGCDYFGLDRGSNERRRAVSKID
jgi:hypothetical protein